jgi:hypothetical protein
VQIAKWDSARDAWTDDSRIDLFSELSDAYLETFPTSGMTVNGVAYELPTWEPATPDSESLSLLRTVMADEAGGGPLSPAMAKHRGQTLRLTGQIIDLVSPGLLPQPLLPTPTTQDGANNGGPPQFNRNTPPLNTRVLMLPTPTVGMMMGGSEARSGGRSGERLLPGVAKDLALLPTPVAQHSGNTPEDHLRKKPGRDVVTDLAIITENDLLPTGGRTSPLSSVGNEPSAAEPPGQLSLLDVMAGNA